jgi:hypothetical protein
MTEGQRLVLVDFDDLEATFSGIEAEFLSRASARDRFRLRVIHRSRHLVGAPLGLVVQDPADHLPKWAEQSTVATVRGYYQRDHPGHEDHIAPISLRSAHVMAADRFLLDRLRGDATAPVAFVHVRRGDYLMQSVGWRPGGLGWVQDGPPVALPAAWYRARMDELRDALPGVRFVLVGDDADWASEMLAGSDTATSDLSASADLALLSRCDAGILSPSSFAWWGAWFAGRRSAGPFLAPLHWLGHTDGEWWPEHVQTPSLEYRPVARSGADTFSDHGE